MIGTDTASGFQLLNMDHQNNHMPLQETDKPATPAFRPLSIGHSGVSDLAGGQMVGDHAPASFGDNDDCLEKRLKEAGAEDSRQLVVEFLQAFFLHQSEVAVVHTRLSNIVGEG